MALAAAWSRFKDDVDELGFCGLPNAGPLLGGRGKTVSADPVRFAGRSHEIVFIILTRVYTLVALCWLKVDVTRRLSAAA